jgi:uncharacterized protein (TIGR01777 family)
MRITISGGTGLIGRRLLKNLAGEGHTLHVLSRHAGANMPANVRLSVWNATKGDPPADSLQDTDVFIHLAGEPVAQRWNADVKQQIRESRVAGTRNLVAAMAKLDRKPQVLVCASAVGYYGSRGDETLDESSPPGNDFLAELCQAWEKEALAAEALGLRVAMIRTGIVLDARGGALAKMLPPFKLGLGGPIAGGKHWMSWIHIHDLVSMYQFALTQPVRGALNGTAPSPERNADFSKALGAALHRPTFLPTPKFALGAMFGEMAEVVLASQRVFPKAAEAAGFRFRFPQLQPALVDLFK